MKLMVIGFLNMAFLISVMADSGQDSQMIRAAMGGDLAKIKELVSAGVQVNLATDKGLSPLMLACFRNHKDVVEFLLQKKAQVNAKDATGMTALMAAAKQGNVDILKALVKAGLISMPFRLGV